MVLATPLVIRQFDLFLMDLVDNSIIHYQPAASLLYVTLNLVPQGLLGLGTALSETG